MESNMTTGKINNNTDCLLQIKIHISFLNFKDKMENLVLQSKAFYSLGGR